MLVYVARNMTHLTLLVSETISLAGVDGGREVCSSEWCLSGFPSFPFCAVNQIQCYEGVVRELLQWKIAIVPSS